MLSILPILPVVPMLFSANRRVVGSNFEMSSPCWDNGCGEKILRTGVFLRLQNQKKTHNSQKFRGLHNTKNPAEEKFAQLG